MQVVIAVAILMIVIVLGVRKYYKIFTGKRSACDCGSSKNKKGDEPTCNCGCAGCVHAKKAEN